MKETKSWPFRYRLATRAPGGFMENLRQIEEALARALDQYPVAFAYVFGSVARGRTHRESDLDVALGFSETVPDQLFYQIQAAINHELAIATEKLDVQDFAALPLAIRFRVIRDGKLVYLTDVMIHREMAFKTLAFYHDEQPVLERYNRMFLTRAASS